jgi:hypothetical protein
MAISVKELIGKREGLARGKISQMMGEDHPWGISSDQNNNNNNNNNNNGSY